LSELFEGVLVVMLSSVRGNCGQIKRLSELSDVLTIRIIDRIVRWFITEY